MESAAEWAEEEFGGADLDDPRRTRRLCRVSAEVARAPAGTVTGACRSSASREGAFRFLESQAVSVGPIAAAASRAALRRCASMKRVHVPIDATTLTLTDEARAKGFGAVGSWRQGSQGIHVMTALPVDAEGSPLGIATQDLWVRERRSRRPEKATSTLDPSRETQHWLDVLRRTHDAFVTQAPDTEAFYQLDRGADCWPVLSMAVELRLLLTVRGAHDRRVDTRAAKLWSELSRAPVRDAFRIVVPARKKIRKRKRQRGRRIERIIVRKPRVARLVVRATTVPLLLANGERVLFNAVFVRESHQRDEDRIEWLLLSTHPIRTRADVRAIVSGYALRWKIEEFHRTWKSGVCCVEDTQLRSRQAVFKWATILASVATRAMRLTYQARETPDVPATEELTRNEIDAIIALREPKGAEPGDTPTLGQAVRWIADLGGYVGPWNGPPGPKVIGRGFDDVLAAARALTNLQKMRKKM
jgi:hypothetical protein